MMSRLLLLLAATAGRLLMMTMMMMIQCPNCEFKRKDESAQQKRELIVVPSSRPLFTHISQIFKFNFIIFVSCYFCFIMISFIPRKIAAEPHQGNDIIPMRIYRPLKQPPRRARLFGCYYGLFIVRLLRCVSV